MIDTPAASSTPIDEDRRLDALHALALLDSEREREFDDLVALAAQLLDCPISLISLIDRDRQWIKAETGLGVTEMRRDVAFCDHTIRTDDVLVIPDATKDPRFADNPLVTGDPQIRFYAGARIMVDDAEDQPRAIGALCVIDHKPRIFSVAQANALRHLSSLVGTMIAARRATREALAIAASAQRQSRALRRHDRTMQQVERMAMIGSWRFTLEDESIFWSNGVYRIHEVELGTTPRLQSALDYYPGAARAEVAAALANTIETGAPFEVETDFITARGTYRRVRSMGELEIENGKPVAIIGAFQDISDRHRVERALRESASIDDLTRIANRAAFNRALENAFNDARGQAAPVMLVLIDLDGFKQTNDRFGHLAGDDVLRAVGERLHAPFLHGSFVARLGGDEFALLLTDPFLIARADRLIDELLALLKIKVVSVDRDLPCSATIGSAVLTPDMQSMRDLIHAADLALYAAKAARRGTAHRFGRERRAAG